MDLTNDLSELQKLLRSSPIARKAYEIWRGQRKAHRIGNTYSNVDFIRWYVREFKKKKWKRPHVARFDHAKPYSFDNIEMQEQAENNRERNARRGNPCSTHRQVHAHQPFLRTILLFASKRDAAAYFGVSEKTVYNHCQGRTKSPGKFGPRMKDVYFTWA